MRSGSHAFLVRTTRRAPPENVAWPISDTRLTTTRDCVISTWQHIFPSRKPRVILISHVFSLGSGQPVLAQFSGWLCSLVVALPHKELGRLTGLPLSLGDGSVSDGVHYVIFTSTTVSVSLPPELTHRSAHLKTLLLCNIIPTGKSVESLYTLHCRQSRTSSSSCFACHDSITFDFQESDHPSTRDTRMSRSSGIPRTSPPPSLPASSRNHAPRFCSSKHKRGLDPRARLIST